MEAEGDDFGGEAQFVLRLRIVSGEHVGGGLAGGGEIVVGAREKQRCEAPDDGV